MKPIIELSPAELPRVRLPCPCGGTICLGFDLLVTGRAAGCDRCPARVRVDLGASRESVDRLNKAMARLMEVRRAIS